MKKTILIVGILFSTLSIAQNSKFSTTKSIDDLQKQYSKINSTDKADYFLHYLKLSEIDRLSKEPAFSKLSNATLTSLVDELYNSKIDLNCSDCNDENKKNQNEKIVKVENEILKKQIVDINDLIDIYNPNGIYSGLQIEDLSTDGKNIYFTRTNGIGAGTYMHKYKIKNNKLKHIKTTKPKS